MGIFSLNPVVMKLAVCVTNAFSTADAKSEIAQVTSGAIASSAANSRLDLSQFSGQFSLPYPFAVDQNRIGGALELKASGCTASKLSSISG